MKTLFLSISLMTLLLAFCSCSKAEETANASAVETFEEVNTSDADLLSAMETLSCVIDSTALSQSEMNGLLQMREEEKLAHDVYVDFYQSYGAVIFDNISESEAKHQDAVLFLLTAYGLDDPSTGVLGTFNKSDIQSLYDQLVGDGTSLSEALKIGAYIEEYDIEDLINLSSATENETILLVYENLMKGSESHLRAFVRNLSRLGVSYTPQILSEEDYNTILSGSHLSVSGNGSSNSTATGTSSSASNGNLSSSNGSSSNSSSNSNGNSNGNG